MMQKTMAEIKISTASEFSRIGAIKFRSGKELKIPNYITKLKKKLELDLICDSKDLEQKPAAICYNITDHDFVHKERAENAQQATLFGESTDLSFISVETQIPKFCDPQTEILYSDIIVPKQALVAIEDSLPKIVKEVILNSKLKNHNSVWNKLNNDDILIPFIRWSVLIQTKRDADVILPFSPVINGDSLVAMNCAFEINKKTVDYVTKRAEITVDPSYYFNINYPALRDINILDKILNFLFYEGQKHDEMDATDLKSKVQFVFIKIINFDQMKSVERINLRDFMAKLANIRDIKGYVLILLDADSIGLPLIANGFDAFVEPLNGIIGFRKGNGKRISKGSWYHPGRDFLEDVPFETLNQNIYTTNNNTLPCACKTCKNLNGKDLSTIDDKMWNKEYRRSHRLNARYREIGEIVKAISENEMRTITDKISQCDRYNKLLNTHL